MKRLKTTSAMDTSRCDACYKAASPRIPISAIVAMSLIGWSLMQHGDSRRIHAEPPDRHESTAATLIERLRHLKNEVAQPDRHESTAAALVERLRSLNDESRIRAEKQLNSDRATIIAALIEQAKVKEEGLPVTKARAIELLGEYRAAEAADILAEDITFVTPWAVTEAGPLPAYSAAMSLVEIGNPWTYRAILGRLNDELTEKELKLFAWTIRYIEGDDEAAPVGLFRLEHELNLRRLERHQADLARGKPLPPSRFERNLERLIAVYKAIDADSGPKNWP